MKDFTWWDRRTCFLWGKVGLKLPYFQPVVIHLSVLLPAPHGAFASAYTSAVLLCTHGAGALSAARSLRPACGGRHRHGLSPSQELALLQGKFLPWASCFQFPCSFIYSLALLYFPSVCQPLLGFFPVFFDSPWISPTLKQNIKIPPLAVHPPLAALSCCPARLSEEVVGWFSLPTQHTALCVLPFQPFVMGFCLYPRETVVAWVNNDFPKLFFPYITPTFQLHLIDFHNTDSI